jgi:hypothetical protein
MDGVQSPENRRERLSSASEHRTVELHDVDISERPKEHLAPIGNLFVGQERTKAMSIEGAQALDLRQRAGHSPLEGLPLRKAFRLTEDDSKQN